MLSLTACFFVHCLLIILTLLLLGMDPKADMEMGCYFETMDYGNDDGLRVPMPIPQEDVNTLTCNASCSQYPYFALRTEVGRIMVRSGSGGVGLVWLELDWLSLDWSGSVRSSLVR